MPETLRIVKGTFDNDTFAPDGSHRFPEGLIVEVGDGHNQVPPLTARRWKRVGFVEDYEGVAGDVVKNQEAGMSAAEAASEIARLQAIHAQAVRRETGGAVVNRRTDLGPAGSRGATESPALSLAEAQARESAALESERGAGDVPYDDPDAGDPWDEYGLTDRQRESLIAAGFHHPEQVADADPADLTGLPGVGPATIARLRGGRD